MAFGQRLQFLHTFFGGADYFLPGQQDRVVGGLCSLFGLHQLCYFHEFQ